MTSPSVVITPLHPDIHTPETPKFGCNDNYQPYSPRLSKYPSRRPQPHTETIDKKLTPAPSSNQRIRSSNRVSKSLQPPIISSFSTQSIQTTWKRPKYEKSLEDVHINKTPNESTSKILDKDDHDFSVSPLNSKSNRRSSPSCCFSMGMLMTPTKTPMKRTKKNPTSIFSVARKLFSDELASHESCSLPLSKKTYEVSLREASSTPDAEEEAQYISIFTDSRDRIPEIDLSPNNPFFLDENTNYSDTSKTPSKPINITVPGEGLQTLDELVRREDGLLYNFRGKAIFRKFDNNNDPNEQAEDGSPDDDIVNLPRNLSHSRNQDSFKPRLLFPPISKSTDEQREEYIAKDLGVESVVEDTSLLTERSAKKVQDTSSISLTSKFQPETPPNTFMATRTTQKTHESNDRLTRTLVITKQVPGETTKLGLRSLKKVRPFATWQCTKPLSERTRKRGGEPLARDGPDKKVKL